MADGQSYDPILYADPYAAISEVGPGNHQAPLLEAQEPDVREVAGRRYAAERLAFRFDYVCRLVSTASE